MAQKAVFIGLTRISRGMECAPMDVKLGRLNEHQVLGQHRTPLERKNERRRESSRRVLRKAFSMKTEAILILTLGVGLNGCSDLRAVLPDADSKAETTGGAAGPSSDAGARGEVTSSDAPAATETVVAMADSGGGFVTDGTPPQTSDGGSQSERPQTDAPRPEPARPGQVIWRVSRTTGGFADIALAPPDRFYAASGTSGPMGTLELMEYTLDGQMRWTKAHQFNEYASFGAINVSRAGDVVVTGKYKLDTDFGGIKRTTMGDEDAFVATYSAQGVLRAVQTFGDVNNDSAAAVSFIDEDWLVVGEMDYAQFAGKMILGPYL
ncbi:MAG TPA: hypothetical protein VGF45_03870, partial [Polyangia bacterium]